MARSTLDKANCRHGDPAVTTIVKLRRRGTPRDLRVDCEIDGQEFKGKIVYSHHRNSIPQAFIDDIEVHDVKIYVDDVLRYNIPPKEEPQQ